ncbi:hypothetical protein CWI39_0226p0030 [Hamiltosporidium magnivora]|uniref:Uncharacterized protein n=1 Tax=Hamiltosporidium magnivora TaxID=148818 RepID=A0A4Q9LIU0_9MICR|nr:hypothetical protein CWI39_0226p0030 [Hamiltosporidium magnivora]
MHEEPTLPLKQASNDEECVKHLKTKNIPLVITGRTMYGEPMINISEELDLEEETVGIKRFQKSIKPKKHSNSEIY